MMEFQETNQMPGLRQVYVVGVGMTRFGRYGHMNGGRLGAEAVRLALKDGGLLLKDVQVLTSGSYFESSGAFSSGAVGFHEAVLRVATGEVDVAMAIGSDVTSGDRRGRRAAAPPGGPVLSPAPDFIQQGYAGAVREYSEHHGFSQSQAAKVAVKNRRHGSLNPFACLQTEIRHDDVLRSPMVEYPNTEAMCCFAVDGAAALIVASAEKARAIVGAGALIRVAASRRITNPRQYQPDALRDIAGMTRNCATQAYQQAAIEPGELDCVELDDYLAGAELLHYETLMLCEEGGAGRMIDESRTSLGGDIPVNTSGGLLSKGFAPGASGLTSICELVWQLRGQAGERQVESPDVGLAQSIDANLGCTVNILIC